MAQHVVELWPPHFEDVQEGRRTFVVQWNSQDFQVGDELILQHHDPCFTGEVVLCHVTHVFKGTGETEGDYLGVGKGYVALSIVREVQG